MPHTKGILQLVTHIIHCTALQCMACTPSFKHPRTTSTFFAGCRPQARMSGMYGCFGGHARLGEALSQPLERRKTSKDSLTCDSIVPAKELHGHIMLFRAYNQLSINDYHISCCRLRARCLIFLQGRMCQCSRHVSQSSCHQIWHSQNCPATSG